MICFCDMEVVCVKYDKLNQEELFDYFNADHENDFVCVVDYEQRYIGRITYNVLYHAKNVKDAVKTECVVLNQDIWVNARTWFESQRKQTNERTILPVVNEKQELICFAYEDFEANRELRMLRELQSGTDVIGFTEIYPKCQCVILNGFNELAYVFAEYLLLQKIAVKVNGILWSGFFQSNEMEFLEYTCMTINAGGGDKTSDWMNNLLQSVSSEFECIDKIYERNVIEGIIKDADKESLIEYLKGIDNVIIIGIDPEAQKAYDYLKGVGIDACCFVDDNIDQLETILLDKPIMKSTEARVKYANPVFLDVHAVGSAWGMGQTDLYDYLGFRRNQGYFLLRDYVNIPDCSLQNTLRNRRIAFVGDIYLCDRLADYLEKNSIVSFEQMIYVETPDYEFSYLHWYHLKADEADPDRIYLIVIPQVVEYKEYIEKLFIIKTFLAKNKIRNFTDYFSHTITFISIEKQIQNKISDDKLAPKKIIIGSIDGCCGNSFFRGLLDNHPAIMMLSYIDLNNDLFWFCVRMANRNAEEIIHIFEEIYCTEQIRRQLDIDLFLAKMHQLLERGKYYTSQELFVVLHVCFMHMAGKNIVNINEQVIYWEPHLTSRYITEEYVQWLGSKVVSCNIINIVRNVFMNNGSYIKYVLAGKWPVADWNFFCRKVMEYPHMGFKEFEYCKRLIMRFEDIKCNPRDELQKLCNEWEIPWSETLMKTTGNGVQWQVYNERKYIKDFDLEPVYNLYEEYFSEYDRFRLALICAPWQKEYGYPVVDILSFTRKQVQEMFKQDFRFMRALQFQDKRERLLFDINFQSDIREILWRIRRFSILGRKED